MGDNGKLVAAAFGVVTKVDKINNCSYGEDIDY